MRLSKEQIYNNSQGIKDIENGEIANKLPKNKHCYRIRKPGKSGLSN